MTNCDADIDWGSSNTKEEEIVEDDDEDNDDEGSDDDKDDSSLGRDEEEDIEDDDMEFDFSCPAQVSFCACDCQLLPLNLLISFLVVTKVTLICLSTGETD